MTSAIIFFYQTIIATPLGRFNAKVPPQMQADQDTRFSGAHWKPIKNETTTIADFELFSDSTGTRYPELYRKWLLAYNCLDFQFGMLKIFGLHPEHQFVPFLDQMQSNTLPKGVSPIGFHLWSLHVLAFDWNNQIISGEPSIRLFSKDQKSTDAPVLVFSTFEKMLDCWNYYLTVERTKDLSEITPRLCEIDPPVANFWRSEGDTDETWNDMFDFS